MKLRDEIPEERTRAGWSQRACRTDVATLNCIAKRSSALIVGREALFTAEFSLLDSHGNITKETSQPYLEDIILGHVLLLVVRRFVHATLVVGNEG